MTDPDLTPFIEQLTRLAELLGAPLTAVQVAGYVEALRDLRLDDLRVAMTQAARECQFFPKPVEIRGFASDAKRARAHAEVEALIASAPQPRPPTEADVRRNEEAFQAFLCKAREVLRNRTM